MVILVYGVSWWDWGWSYEKIQLQVYISKVHLEEGEGPEPRHNGLDPPGQDLGQLQTHVEYGGAEEEEIVKLRQVGAILVQKIGKIHRFL